MGGPVISAGSGGTTGTCAPQKQSFDAAKDKAAGSSTAQPNKPQTPVKPAPQQKTPTQACSPKTNEPASAKSIVDDASKRLAAEQRRLETILKTVPSEMRGEIRDAIHEIETSRKELSADGGAGQAQSSGPPAASSSAGNGHLPSSKPGQPPGPPPQPPYSPLPTNGAQPGTGGGGNGNPGAGNGNGGVSPPATPGHPPVYGPPISGPPVYGPQLPPVAGQGHGGQGNGVQGGTPVPGTAHSATPFNPATDPVVDTAKWIKEGLFAVRAFGRTPIEGFSGKDGLIASTTKQLEALKAVHPPGAPPTPAMQALESRLATLSRLGNMTKLIGLGGFSIAANVQKGREIYGYWTSGDTGDKYRAAASGSEFLNNIRLGITGITPFLKEGTAFQRFATNYMGGTFGTKLGVGANVLAGGFKGYGAIEDYQRDSAAATNQYGRDKAYSTLWEKEGGIALDTFNDVFPYVAGMEPLAWSSWLAGKLADHGAQTMLADSGYKPVSIGAEWSRNLTPLFTGLTGDLLGIPGAPKTTPLRDMSLPMSYDAQVVASFDNRIHYAAGIGTGVTDLGIKAVEFGATAYFSGGTAPPSVYYAVAQADHIARQGINVWTDHYWQRPQERAASVAAAGLDPALDTRQVVHEQPDFLHRLWASASAGFNRGFLDTREEFGNNSATEQRWLELDKAYTDPAISTASPRNGNSWFERAADPANLVTIYSYTVPGLKPVMDGLKPENVGAAAAYVEEGWQVTSQAVSSAASATADAATFVWNNPGQAAGMAADATLNTLESGWNAAGSAWNSLWD